MENVDENEKNKIIFVNFMRKIKLRVLHWKIMQIWLLGRLRSPEIFMIFMPRAVLSDENFESDKRQLKILSSS